MATIKYHIENMQQWLAHMLQTRAARRIMLSLMVLLGVIFIVKGSYSIRHWQENVAQMEGQLIPVGWAWEITMANVILQLAIGAVLVISVWFGRLRGGALAAACLLLFVYAAYSRVVQIKQLVAVAPCACIGWLEGMTWSSVLRTNIILLVITTLVWLAYTYHEERRSVDI